MSGGFQLEDGSAPRWAEWAALYGSSERTLKRWEHDGRAKNDPCPLGRPGEMPGWWARNMAQRVPAKVLAAAAAVAGGVSAPVAPQANVVSVGRELQTASDDEVGIGATLKRLQDLEVDTHGVYLAALKSGDDGKAAMALKNYKDLAAEVVKVREKWRDDSVKMRDLIPRVEAEAVISEIHAGVMTRFRGSGEDFLRGLGVPVTPANLAKWQGLIDGLCSVLQKEVFDED